MKLVLLALLLAVVVISQCSAYYPYAYRPYGYGYRPYGYGYPYAYRPYGYGYPSAYRPYGYGYYGRRDTHVYRRSVVDEPVVPKVPFVKPECIYYSEDQWLECQGGWWLLQCPTELHLNTSLFNAQFFGVEFWHNVSGTHDVAFNLYPRGVDNTIWLNHTIWLDNHFVDFRLYWSDVPHDDVWGFRVLDQHCYQDLVELFSKSNVDYEIGLVHNEVFKFFEWNATVIGDILVI